MTHAIDWPALFQLALIWLGYFIVHSGLASERVKRYVARRWTSIARYYRLYYNLFASVLLVPPLWLLHALNGPWLWKWQGAAAGWADGLAAAAIAGFIWSLRYYSGANFLGLRPSSDTREHLRISPLHRYVRHPWYFFALIIIWTRDMTAAWLVSACLISLYFVLGSRLEERKLIAAYGEAYRRYQGAVPALFPLPWRILDKNTAQILERRAITPGTSSATSNDTRTPHD